MSGNVKQAKCIICDKSVLLAYRPFCSKRCADVDLNRWLKGAYVIPGEEEAGMGAVVPDQNPLFVKH